MTRWHWALAALSVFSLASGLSAQTRAASQQPFSVVEASIPEMQAALSAGRTTSREIVRQSLTRIALYEERLNVVIAVNPRALQLADSLDRERAAGRVKGPLHGIPIALKDNIQTIDMPTTGGALAFRDYFPPYEATLTRNLRDAGAIIIAKTAMIELANWVSGQAVTLESAVGGRSLNPYDPRIAPDGSRLAGLPVLDPGGSSSGGGTATSFWAANVGTETIGSIIGPANVHMLAAIKPTVGRISRWGVIPLATDQDTPGPMARTVTDAAILLGVMEGSTADPKDPATSVCARPPRSDYRPFLKPDALRGARIGIPRAGFFDPTTIPGRPEPRDPLSEAEHRAMEGAIETLRAQGAVIVDPANLPSILATDRAQSFFGWSVCAGLDQRKGMDEGCSITLKYGMKRDFNRWLETLGASAPVKSLGELRAWNIEHQRAGAIELGQALLDISDEMDVEGDRARYQADRSRELALLGTNGFEAILKAERLDALVFPGGSSVFASVLGYPIVTVPFARVPNLTPNLPEGFAPEPIPEGVDFVGLPCTEPRLLAITYAFEQATHRRVPPPAFP